jgi:hypothetical protein
MGRWRSPNTSDEVYAERRARYERDKERLAMRAKERYIQNRPALLAAAKAARDAARLARLQQKRKERYGEHLERLAGGEGRKHRMKQYGQQAKEGRPCFDCGVAYPNYVMDFDHVRGTKDRDVSACTTLAMLKREIAKCDLVCANCHRERTFRRRTDLLPT